MFLERVVHHLGPHRAAVEQPQRVARLCGAQRAGRGVLQWRHLRRLEGRDHERVRGRVEQNFRRRRADQNAPERHFAVKVHEVGDCAVQDLALYVQQQERVLLFGEGAHLEPRFQREELDAASYGEQAFLIFFVFECFLCLY